MSMSALLNIAALLALVPAAVVSWRGEGARTSQLWLCVAVALAGTVSWTWVLFQAGWRADLPAALWMTVTISLAIYVAIATASRRATRLAPLMFPYLILLGLIASLIGGADATPRIESGSPTPWVIAHIAVSVVTYALATLAAISGVAVFVQERALKSKRPTALSRALPAYMEGERLQFLFLVAAEIVLGFGLLTGIALNFYSSGTWLVLDHKAILSVTAFVLIGLLLIAHLRLGVRGRLAARAALIAYLALTLAYPGVKFVTDVLIG